MDWCKLKIMHLWALAEYLEDCPLIWSKEQFETQKAIWRGRQSGSAGRRIGWK
jgi:hypothetical protein